MQQHLDFIERMTANGGPEPSEYDEFSQWLETIRAELEAGTLTPEDLSRLRNCFGEALSILTLQGFAYEKPHGYPGDYEILDKIYQKYTSKNPNLRKWDLFFQLQKAPLAVRNRKDYFIRLLHNLEAMDTQESKIHVLNIASGPSRDLFEFLSESNQGKIIFDNVEFDPLAISYAKNLCKDFTERINFLHTNAFAFSSKQKYRLIWSAGLFDYLNEKKFVFLLNRIVGQLDDQGEIVIGNFSTVNPSRAYMEIVGNWHLIHRTPDELISLARTCGFDDKDIRVGQEPEGINLFLHLKRGAEFITAPRTVAFNHG